MAAVGLTDADANKVLGVSLDMRDAGAVIHETAMALRLGASIDDVIEAAILALRPAQPPPAQPDDPARASGSRGHPLFVRHRRLRALEAQPLNDTARLLRAHAEPV